MVEPRIHSRLVRSLGIGTLMLLLPACQSPGERRWQWGWRQPPGSSNIAYRPAYEWPGTKRLYLSGYAGVDYSPNRPRRRDRDGLAPIPAANPPGVTIDQGTWETE
jgi:hypothetical protein